MENNHGNLNWHEYNKTYQMPGPWNPNDGAEKSVPYSLADFFKNIDEDDDCSSKTERKNSTMKKCEVCLPDGNGKAQIGQNCFFICPTHSGFILFVNPTGSEVEMHCFESFKSVVNYLQENELFDLTDNKVAENI